MSSGKCSTDEVSKSSSGVFLVWPSVPNMSHRTAGWWGVADVFHCAAGAGRHSLS